MNLDKLKAQLKTAEAELKIRQRNMNSALKSFNRIEALVVNLQRKVEHEKIKLANAK